MKKRKLWLIIPLAVLLLLAAGAAVYVGDYYHADPAALAEQQLPGISVTAENDRIVFRPDTVKAGLIFYPGGKVEFTAYAPLMTALAEEGFLCVLLKMPLNLAVLNANAADGVRDEFPEAGSWILAGHSLGGVFAASYAGKHSAQTDGLLLLASYPVSDLKESGLRILSLYGSEDGVLNFEKYDKAREYLPADAEETVIAGGCHAGFGMYGAQKGDGVPTISSEEQIRLTAETVSAWYFGGSSSGSDPIPAPEGSLP